MNYSVTLWNYRSKVTFMARSMSSLFPGHNPFLFDLEVALQILGRTFYKDTKNASLYSQSLLIFIHKAPVVENHPTTREIRELHLAQVDTNGNHGIFFTLAARTFTYWKYTEESFKHSV